MLRNSAGLGSHKHCTTLNSLSKFHERNAVANVSSENPVQNVGKLGRDGQNLLQESGVLEVLLVGLVGDVGPLPRVTATEEVDGDDS